MLEAVPYQVHTILTDNGIQFAEQSRNRNTIYSRPVRFDMICEADGIEQRLTKPNHPWTNGQVERMNRTIKEATVKRFHYQNQDQLRTHLADFLAAYNFARRLKSLNGLTPYVHLKNLDIRAGSIHPRPDPPDAGTEHLMCLGPAIDTPSPLPARTGDGVGYSAEHLVA